MKGNPFQAGRTNMYRLPWKHIILTFIAHTTAATRMVLCTGVHNLPQQGKKPQLLKLEFYFILLEWRSTVTLLLSMFQGSVSGVLVLLGTCSVLVLPTLSSLANAHAHMSTNTCVYTQRHRHRPRFLSPELITGERKYTEKLKLSG